MSTKANYQVLTYKPDEFERFTKLMYEIQTLLNQAYIKLNKLQAEINTTTEWNKFGREECAAFLDLVKQYQMKVFYETMAPTYTMYKELTEFKECMERFEQGGAGKAACITRMEEIGG